MKHKKLIGIVATSALLLGSVATFAACGGDAHTIERVDEKQATCTEGGHAAYYKCTDEGCDKLFSDIDGKHEITWDDVEKTDPLGHDMKHVNAKAATCTEEGTNDHYHCDRCELNFTDEAGSAQKSDAVINALGHDMEAVAKKIPVTGQPGVKAHYRCKRENAEYFDSFGDKKVTDENKHELEYNMLTTAPNGWYASEHDFSHVNDADPYMTISASNGLNVATSEFYTDIAFTARIQKSKSTREYVELFFENKSIYSVYVENGKIYHNGSTPEWDYDKNGYTNLADSWADGYTLSKGEQDSYEGDGLEVTLARTGKTVKVLVDGQERHSATLADEYVSEPVQGVMRVWSAQPGEKYYFRAEPQTPTAAAPKVTVAAVDAAQGAVTLNKDANAYAYDDELVITIAPTANYIYDTFTVNGRDVTAFVNKGAGNFTYTTTATANVKIEVTFKEKEFGSIDASVTGKKNGVTGNSIANNAEYTLIGKYEDITGTLSAGKIDKTNVIAGEYILKIEGYLDTKITVAKDTPYTTAIALGYDMFSMLHTDNGGDGYYNLVNTKNDFAHQNDANGYLSVLNGSDGMWVAYTNDDYNDLYFTATFKAGNCHDGRKAIQLVFADGKGIQFGLKQDGEGVLYGYYYSDRYLLNKGESARLAPEEKFGNLTAGQLTKYNGDGITVSVARKGSTILLLVDGKIVNGLEVAASYATATCKAAIVVEWAGAQDIGVAVSETFDFATPTFTLTPGENGTVTKTSGDTYSVWDKITLEIAPAADYRLKQLTVNGVVIAGNRAEYSFFPVDGANTVVAEFEAIPYGNITFTADKKWNADGLVVTFKRGAETKTVTLGNNAVIENMAMDTWTATTVVGNMTVSLGDVFIDKQNFTLDLAKMFNNADVANNRIVSANLATGEFVYNTEPSKETLWLNTVNVAQGSKYIVTRISLPTASKDFLKNSGSNHENFSIYLKVGDVEKNCTLWWKQDENAFKFFSLDNWQGSDNLSDELKNAFIDGDGFYIVWAYNAENGNYEIYAGLTPQTVAKIGEWNTGLPANGTLTTFGFGDGIPWGGQSYQLNVQLNCGDTLNEALGITE